LQFEEIADACLTIPYVACLLEDKFNIVLDVKLAQCARGMRTLEVARTARVAAGHVHCPVVHLMPSLTIDDFKPFSVTCELRYKSAFLIYDRTGQVLEDMRKAFTNITVAAASPPQTTFAAEEGSFTLELGACRFTSSRLDKNAETFAKHCTVFFDAVTNQLQVNVFTRIGLRYIARKEFKTLDEAKAALASMTLANLKPTKRFNSSESPTEVMFRWEDAQIGAFVRLRAETVEITSVATPELQDHVPKIDKKLHGLTLDIDYYTVAPVEREQWSSLEWVQQKHRIVKKEADSILQGGR